jgi:hypothetical protein
MTSADRRLPFRQEAEKQNFSQSIAMFEKFGRTPLGRLTPEQFLVAGISNSDPPLRP